MNQGRSDEADRFVHGRGSYVGDLVDPGALWLQVARSDIAHGIVEGVDVDEATGVDGVVAILTGADLDLVPTIPIRIGATPLLKTRLQPVLATRRVRYVGEPLAVVVAETAAAAEEAASRVWPNITPLVPVNTVDSEISLWDDSGDNVLLERTAYEGDVDAVFAAAANVAALELSTARRTGAPIETRGMMAVWEEGVLHTWGPTKYVNFTALTLSELFGLDPGQVICHRVDVGGMFGVRGEFYPEDFLVPWAAQITGRPVRWQENRREHLSTINHAPEQHHLIEIAVSTEGRLSGLRSEVTVDMGAYPRPTGDLIPEIILDMMPGPYAWDAYRVRCKAVSTSKTPTGPMRGPSALETTFVRERAVDLAARRAKQDPIGLRRRSLIPAARMPFSRATAESTDSIQFDSGDFLRVFDDALEKSDHSGWVRERDRRRDAGEHVGIGVGAFIIHSAVGGQETVVVQLETSGQFLIRTSASDVGQGLDAMARHALAGLLGVEESEIGVWSGDTESHRGGNGTFASRSTVFVANALADAANRFRSEARRNAATLLGCEPHEVILTAGGPASDGERLGWKEIAPIEATGSFEMRRPTYGFGVDVALASVDVETGEVRPERLVVAYDCGRALNHANIVDQLIGAAAMGVGASLYERLVYDDDGNPISSNLSDYLLPTSTALPLMEAMVFETAPAGGNPLGLKGVGEPGIAGVGAAIANAVVDALGPAGDTIITRLPINRQDIALHPSASRCEAVGRL